MLRLLLLALLSLCTGCHSPAGPKVDVLFDGKTLAGWVTQGGHYDGNASWTVEDGALTGRQGPNGEGGLIYTEREYSDFLFCCDFKIEEPMDSGVFVDMVPALRGYQVTIDTPKDGELGGIYSDGWLQHNPDGWKDFKKGEWNTLWVRVAHDPGKGKVLLEAQVNDRPLVHYAAAADPDVFARAGRIGLQVHGGQGMAPNTKVQFRNIEIMAAPAGSVGR